MMCRALVQGTSGFFIDYPPNFNQNKVMELGGTAGIINWVIKHGILTGMALYWS